MAFMRAFIEPVSGFNVETDCGSEFVSDDCVMQDRPTADDLAEYVEGSQDSIDADSIEYISGFRSGISASGYMDQSICGVFETKIDAAEAVLSEFFDLADNEMDADEIEDRDWLDSIVNKKVN